MMFSKKSSSFTLMISIFTLSCFMFMLYHYMTSSSLIYVWDLTFSKSMYLSFSFIMDWISTTFLLTLLLVTLAVSLFSLSYMKTDKHQNQFLFTLSTFIASMMFFIPNNNFLTMLIGWDGLGISSFLLIIYYQTPKGLFSGMVTSFTNRIGDVLILSCLSSFFLAGSSSMNNNQSLSSLSFFSSLITLLFLVASFTKSAQTPFSSWLPAAMAAPTPVSALVHSSTLVTAGIFLMIRVTSSVKLTMPLMMITLLTALLTSVMAGMAATMEPDVKKLIALSTLSQLGMMMFSISMNNNKIAFFHLISHASFKALLFISAGWVLVMMNHKQDTRELGELNMISNSSLIMITVASMSLMALPFLSGFYSKDIILENYFTKQFSLMSLFLVLAATALTSIYSMKMLTMIHNNSLSHSPMTLKLAQPISHNLAAAILSSGSIFLSSFLMWNISPVFIHPTIMPEIKSMLILVLLSTIMIMMSCTNMMSVALLPMMNVPSEMNLQMSSLTPISHSLTTLTINKMSANTSLLMEDNWIHQSTSSMPNMIISTIAKSSSYFFPSFNFILMMFMMTTLMILT
uniref:NADH dehydrogenase subunit 5 n=1 Tax=Iheyomytilidicola lauensis TaxID=998671 RepID=UPI001EE10D51|nr:NADH dehydrogenase subunit 5 [Iheyomytilidicola lauensis]UJV31458.1 NADH dehydrogenase subunit 5 [Iheyomytilidicola lauensis]